MDSPYFEILQGQTSTYPIHRVTCWCLREVQERDYKTFCRDYTGISTGIHSLVRHQSAKCSLLGMGGGRYGGGGGAVFQQCWCLGHLSQVPDSGSESPEPSESVRIKICSIKSRVEASGFLGLRCGHGLMLVQSFIVWVKGLGV